MNFANLYASLTTAERDQLAKSLESDAGYLWQLATRWRDKRPSIEFMQKLVAADGRLTISELVEEFSRAAPAKDVTPPVAPPAVTKAA